MREGGLCALCCFGHSRPCYSLPPQCVAVLLLQSPSVRLSATLIKNIQLRRSHYYSRVQSDDDEENVSERPWAPSRIAARWESLNISPARFSLSGGVSSLPRRGECRHLPGINQPLSPRRCRCWYTLYIITEDWLLLGYNANALYSAPAQHSLGQKSGIYSLLYCLEIWWVIVVDIGTSRIRWRAGSFVCCILFIYCSRCNGESS